MSQGVEFNRLMLEMRSMQAEAMARQKPVASTPEPGAPSFSEMLGQAVGKVNETQQASTKLAEAFEVGKSGVDLTDVMIASQKASDRSRGPPSWIEQLAEIESRAAGNTPTILLHATGAATPGKTS
jgi:flagellar hook-basal body complex protein FliE